MNEKICCDLICNKHNISAHYLSGIKRPRWKCKLCDRDYQIIFLKNLKKKCLDYKGGKCERCKYDKCVRSMHFHHVDPSLKEFSISDRNPNTNKNGTKKWDSVKKELDKCILLCSNCHYEVHEELDKQAEKNNLGLHRQRLHLLNQHILKGRKTAQDVFDSI